MKTQAYDYRTDPTRPTLAAWRRDLKIWLSAGMDRDHAVRRTYMYGWERECAYILARY